MRAGAAAPVVIALGSNLGDRIANLRAAIRLMQERGIRVARASSAWETPPMPEDQPAYLNAVVSVETDLGPVELLGALKAIEHELGRRPGRRWGPRPIDLDLLFYGEQAVSTTDLEVPHPRIAERGFVLAPLAEVLRGPLPVIGKRAVELLAGVERAGLARTGLRLRD